MLDKRLLSEFSNKYIRIYAIPQTQIIKKIGLRYTGGGHHFVYRQIPMGEIWVAEEYTKSLEYKYYIYHELYEYNKMAMGMNYDDAHILANRVEGKVRKAPVSEIDDLIELELMKISSTIPERSHFNGTLKLHVDGASHHAHHTKKHSMERMRGNGVIIVK